MRIFLSLPAYGCQTYLYQDFRQNPSRSRRPAGLPQDKGRGRKDPHDGRPAVPSIRHRSLDAETPEGYPS